MAAHIVLEESGEKYQPQQVDLAGGEQRTEAYLKLNPQGRVPVLRLDNGEPLAENTAILPYLGRRFGLWPTEAVADAKALSLIGFFAVKILLVAAIIRHLAHIFFQGLQISHSVVKSLNIYVTLVAAVVGLAPSPAGAEDRGVVFKNVAAGLVFDVIGAHLDNGQRLTIYPRNGNTNQIFDLQDGKIVARHSGKCLDVLGFSLQDGGAVGQWDCHGQANQRWRILDIDYTGPCPAGQCFRFVAHVIQSVHSGKCLDVSNPHLPNPPQKDALLQQWSCARNGFDRWWVNQVFDMVLAFPPPIVQPN
jgi:hypothetical protein